MRSPWLRNGFRKKLNLCITGAHGIVEMLETPVAYPLSGGHGHSDGMPLMCLRAF